MPNTQPAADKKPSEPGRLDKPWWMVSALLVAGTILGIALMLASPSSYFAIAQSISWRLNWPPVVQEKLERTLIGLQLRGDALVENDAILMFGDSHLQAIPGPRLGTAVNYAIGGETAEHLARRMERYPSLRRVKGVIILTGRNDLAADRTPAAIDESMGRAFAHVPAKTAITLVAIPPGAEPADRIAARRETNSRFEQRCAARPHCRFVAVESLADEQGRLPPRFDAGDGIHLNASGYELLIARIKDAVSRP